MIANIQTYEPNVESFHIEREKNAGTGSPNAEYDNRASDAANRLHGARLSKKTTVTNIEKMNAAMKKDTGLKLKQRRTSSRYLGRDATFEESS